MLPITTSTSDELFSHINIDDYERSSAAVHTPRINCDEMAGDRLTVCKQELL